MRSTVAEPHLPSFTLVLTQAAGSGRLPEYRSSHRLRFHPYPRYASRTIQEDHMDTVDHRYDDVHTPATLPSATRVDEEDAKIGSNTGSTDKPKQKIYLSTLIYEVILAVRRKLAGPRFVDENEKH